jgi:hypothetical protein
MPDRPSSPSLLASADEVIEWHANCRDACVKDFFNINVLRPWFGCLLIRHGPFPWSAREPLPEIALSYNVADDLSAQDSARCRGSLTSVGGVLFQGVNVFASSRPLGETASFPQAPPPDPQLGGAFFARVDIRDTSCHRPRMEHATLAFLFVVPSIPANSAQ